MAGTCYVEGCPNKALGRYCSTHYERLRLTGSLEPRRRGPAKVDPVIRFERQVIRPESGCHLWTGSVASRYGTFFTGERLTGAHRFAWEQAHGPLPKRRYVLHHCDQPLCVRTDPDLPAWPDGHLFVGSQKENLTDAVSKGRVPRGERHYLARFTWDQVREMRARFRAGEVTPTQLVRETGASDTAVRAILDGRTWREG